MTDEQERLEELREYDVLDTEREPAFDRLVELAALACGTPMAFLAFVDENRVWHKAEHGAQLGETARDGSLCSDAIRTGRMMLVEDTARDERFARYPAVQGPLAVRSYAGAPLVTPRGHVLGTLCVLDRQPRRISVEAQRALLLLRDQVMHALEARRERLDLRSSESLREEAVEALLATKIDLERRIELRTRELESERRRFEEVLARVADGFGAIDRDGRFMYLNERAAQMMGRPLADLIGKHFFAELPKGMDKTAQRDFGRAMRELKPVTRTGYYEPWDRWYEARYYPSPDGCTVFVSDITEQRRTEARLAEAQAVAHVGSWQWTVADNHVIWSEEMYRIYGMTREQHKDGYEGFLSMVHPDDVEHTKAVIGDALQNPRPFIYDHRIVRPDGSVRMLHTRGEVMVDAQKQPARMVGSCWDVTERWEATRELERAGAVLDAVMASSQEAVLVVDADDRVREVNQRFLQLFAVPRALIETRRAVPLYQHIAGELRDGVLFAVRVREARERPQAATDDVMQLGDGKRVRCTSKCYSFGGRVAGRVWTFGEPT